MIRHLRRSRLFLFGLTCALFVSGCAHQYVLEDLGLVLVAGYDLADDGKLLVTMTMPQVALESEEKIQTITGKGDVSKEARENISLTTDRQVVSGQLRTVIFSEKLARQGVWRTLDTLLRDVNITNSVILTISDGEARELLTQKFPYRPSSGRYTYELLRKEAKNFTIPNTTFHDFQRDYHDDGRDAVAPYLQRRGTTMVAAGTALFREDKFVGSLSPEETKMLLLLQDRGEGGDIKQTIAGAVHSKGSQPDQIVLTFVRAKNKYELEQKNGKPVINYVIDVQGQVIEYTGLEPLTDEKVMK
jgi:spore germination protein